MTDIIGTIIGIVCIGAVIIIMSAMINPPDEAAWLAAETNVGRRA